MRLYAAKVARTCGLVVIDPDDREELAAIGKPLGWPDVDRFQAVLRSLVTPPKPPEPQGLGAVVEDADGHWWSRLGGTTEFPWHHGTLGRERYAELTAVKVLSTGVTS